MIDEKQVQEADARHANCHRLRERVRVDVGEMGKRRPRVRHREHAAGTVHGIVRSGPRYQDCRRTCDSEIARCAGRLPKL